MKRKETYIESQMRKLSPIYSEYPAKIKLIRPDHAGTNWLDITEEQLEQIRSILISGDTE